MTDNASRPHPLYLAAMVAILWLGYALRVHALPDILPGIHHDTGRVTWRIWRWTQGDGLFMYFQDFVEPFDIMLRGVYHQMTGGYHLYMSQMLTVSFYLLATAAVAQCARILYRRHPQRDLISLIAALTLTTLPPAVQLTFHVFRANTLPLTPILALTALVVAWRSGRWLPAILAGIFMGFAAMVYSGGIFVPLALGLVGLVELWRGAGFWRRFQQGIVIVVSFAITMLPWLYYFVTVGSWTNRISRLSSGASPMSDPSLFGEYFAIAASLIVAPNPTHDLRYMPYTTGFLNPALIVLFVIGIAITMWHWRRAWYLAPLILGVVMLLPNVLSSEPQQPVRLVGTFGAIALLVGLGAGEIVRWTSHRQVLKNGMLAALGLVTIATPIYALYHLWYHYTEQPLINNPHVVESMAQRYRVGFYDLLVDSATHDEATYLPLMHLNTDLAIVTLRPRYLPDVIPYDGRALPAGRLILPRSDLSYGFFTYEQIPIQYGVLLPDTGEIMLLPPLDLAAAEALANSAQTNGTVYTNDEGWELGQVLPISTENNPFADVRIPDIAPDATPLAVFDNTLELMAIDAPQTVVQGGWMPVTLYWRVRDTGQPVRDYFSRMQLWDTDNQSFAAERTAPAVVDASTIDFPLNIHFYIYPTVQWEAGEIVPDTRWLRVAPDVPTGAYRFALAVYGYPGVVPLSNTTPSLDQWSLVGRTAVNGDMYLAPADAPETGIFLGDSYELVDYSLSTPVDSLAAGDTVDISVTWYVHQTTQRDTITAVHLLDSTDALVAQQDVSGFGGAFPTWAWQAGNTVTLDYTLTIPDDAQGPFQLVTLMYNLPEVQRLPATQRGEPLTNDVIPLE